MAASSFSFFFSFQISILTTLGKFCLYFFTESKISPIFANVYAGEKSGKTKESVLLLSPRTKSPNFITGDIKVQ